MKECVIVNSGPGNTEKRPVALSGASLFAVLLFTCLLACLLISTMNASPAHAAESGVVKGVPWRITSDYDLILGEDDKTYNLRDLAIGDDIPDGGKVKRVYALGKLIAGSKCQLFKGSSSLTSISINSIDTSKLEDMSSMFEGCEKLKRIDLNGFDTSNVTDMNSLFAGCVSLESISIDGFDTSNVTNMGSMFSCCRALKSLNLSGFDTSNVTNMSFMFFGCEALKNINLSGFDTGNVTDMGDMFIGCHVLERLDLRAFDTSKVKNMESMFCACYALKSLDLSSFDTGNVRNTRNMFQYCNSLKRLDLSSFVLGKNVNKSYMFKDSGIQQIALGNKTMLIGCNFVESDPILPGPGPWKRISTLNGKQANGPIISGLEKYIGSAPGWYRFLSPNPIKLKGKTVKIKRKYLKKKAKVIKRAKALQVTNAQGKVTYQLTGVKKAKFKKYFKVDTNTGNITVRKKLKKGKYKLSIKAMAAGNNWYNKATKGATVVIKVK